MHFDEKKMNYEQITGIVEKHGYFSLSKAKTCDEVREKTTETFLK